MYLKSKSLTDRKATIYTVIFKKLLRTTKKEYFNNLDTKKVSDNGTFWITVFLFFQKKVQKIMKLS